MSPSLTSEHIERSVVSAVRKTARNPLPEHISANHGFVTDLGFDSMSISMLGLALEDEFNCAILMSGWVERHAETTDLTVGSLCEYLRDVLAAP